MATGASGAHGPKSRPSVVEWAGLVTALASLVVAVVALGLAYSAWTRPYPADPTLVPSWGSGGDPRVIENPADALVFMQFLEDNAGRKVRINAELSSDYYSGLDRSATFSPKETGFTSPSENCSDVPLSELSDHFYDDDNDGVPGCDFMAELRIEDVGPERPGMYYLHGSWYLTGYFASEGFVDFHMWFRYYAITPLTTIEAVN